MNILPTSRPNFFLLLELHPNEPWNEERYQKALRTKREQWSRESQGIAKKALSAQMHLSLLPLLQKTMEDPDLRQEECVAARKVLAHLYRLEREQFEKQIALLNMKETAENEEVEKFIADFKHIMPPAEIRKRIKVSIRSSSDQTGDKHKVLDRSLAKNIADRLDILHMKTLYEFLQAAPTDDIETLFHASEELYTQLVRLRPSVETTVRMELSGFAMTIFTSEETRAQYDETLRLQSLQNLFADLDASMERATRKELYPRQILFYLTQAQKAGWQQQDALEQLKEHAQHHNWFLILPTSEQLRTSQVVSSPGTFTAQVHEATRGSATMLYQDEDVADVYQLQYQVLRSSIRLYWQWPTSCQAAYVFTKARPENKQDATQEKTATVTRLVSRTEYDRLGYYDVPGKWNHHYAVQVSAVSERDGKQVIAPGVHISAHLYRTVITYEIQLIHFPLRKRILYLKTVTPTPLPTLLVVSKQETLPLRKTDGHLLHRFSGQTNEHGELSIVLPATRLPPHSWCKLFLDDDRLYSAITIHHPSEQKLRLS